MERLYIDRENGRLERTDLCQVKLILSDGTVYERLQPRRLFPYTMPSKYITLLGDDGHEVAVVRDMDQLDDGSKDALNDALSEYYMIPKIQRLLAIEDINGALKWRVLTDHGEIEFRIHNRNSDIKLLRGTRKVLVRDADDNRYLIPDHTALDHHSKHLLYAYL